MKFLREFSQKFEIKQGLYNKSWRCFLHLSSFSYSNSFKAVGPETLLVVFYWLKIYVGGLKRVSFFVCNSYILYELLLI